MGQINALNAQLITPKISPAQQRLDEESMKGSDWLKSRDFRDMKNSGMFFNFDQPADQNRRRTTITNAAQGGTFGLADTNGETGATQLQSKYLADKFARDDAQNFQNNVAQGAQGVIGGLTQSSNAAAAQDARDLQGRESVLSTLGNVYNNQKSGFNWGSLIGLGATVAGAF